MDPNQIAEGELTEEEQIYKENILDHYKNPHNAGILNNFTLKHKEFNPLCGDQLELFMKFDTKNMVSDVRFKGSGCAISQAAMSMLTDVIKNKSVQELNSITPEEVLKMLGISIGVVRMKCALLCLKTLHTSLGGTNYG